MNDNLIPLHDDRILADYRAVLSRPRFAFAREDVGAVLEGIEQGGETVFAKPLPLELPDPDDLPFLEVAAAARADALVTGNPRHYQPVRGKHEVEILSPRELIDRLSRS
jgi:uncharacterized protein